MKMKIICIIKNLTSVKRKDDSINDGKPACLFKIRMSLLSNKYKLI